MHELAVAVGGLRRQLGVERQLLGAVVRRLGRRVRVAACTTCESLGAGGDDCACVKGSVTV